MVNTSSDTRLHQPPSGSLPDLYSFELPVFCCPTIAQISETLAAIGTAESLDELMLIEIPGGLSAVELQSIAAAISDRALRIAM